ncbi:MAG: YdcF family protein [Propionibacteriaceae bacterium]|nr:YdcF family protein [Propionibacteriaceae bacterium]
MPSSASPEAAKRNRPCARSGAIGTLGFGALSLAAVAGSVGFVRATAAGHLFSAETVPAAPVALVLGALVFPDGTPSPFLAARLDLARSLWAAGKVTTILVSGDSLAPEYNEPDAMRHYLIASGVPAEQVLVDDAGLDTYQSCAQALRHFGVSELIVVTQSYHLPRAVATCLRLGIRATGVGDDTARQFTAAWRRCAIRDQIACVKTVIDLLTDHRRWPPRLHRMRPPKPERSPRKARRR